MMETISIDNEAHTPSHNWSWNSLLANREKANLVLYVCHKMLESNDLLATDKKFDVSIEGDLDIVTSSTTTKCPFKNNNEEADTRIFWLTTMTQGNVLVQSTDKDILAIALINFTELQLDNRSIVIQYGSNDYCNLKKLVELLEESTDYSLLRTRGIAIPRIISALHFIIGCDDLPYLQGFIKGATKWYFTHYSFVVFILFNPGLCKSAFSTSSFRKLVFSSFCAFCLFCLLRSNLL